MCMHWSDLDPSLRADYACGPARPSRLKLLGGPAGPTRTHSPPDQADSRLVVSAEPTTHFSRVTPHFSRLGRAGYTL